MVEWSLVKLASVLRHCFMLLNESCHGTRFLGFRKNGLTCYPMLCCFYLCDVPYPSWAFGRHYPILSGQMPSYFSVRRQGFDFYILVTQDPSCDLSLFKKEVMAIVAVNNLQNFCLVKHTISMAYFYKLRCWPWPSDIRLLQAGCSCGLEEPLVLVSLNLEMMNSVLKVSCLQLA